jgi:hypothetical protein
LKARTLFIAAAIAYCSSIGSSAPVQGSRIGAICNDGWRSHATGRGACSHHHGVERWLYEQSPNPLRPMAMPLSLIGHASTLGALIVGAASRWRPQGPRVTCATPEAKPPIREAPWRGSHTTDPQFCPKCGGKLLHRRRKRDGRPFLGCSHYPRCRYVLDLNAIHTSVGEHDA